MSKNVDYSGLTLLGHSETLPPRRPSPKILETFPNGFTDRNYEVLFNCPEFTSMCPVTSQPDFGRILLHYIPGERCVESKSLKLYLMSFRNHGAFHEEVVNLVLDAIVKVCSPRWAEVVGLFNPRGGISIQVRAATGAPPPGARELPLSETLGRTGEII